MNAQRTNKPMTDSYYPNGVVMYLMQEDLARARMQESHRAAAQQRLARRLTSAKRWSRLANWAARHAAEAKSSL